MHHLIFELVVMVFCNRYTNLFLRFKGTKCLYSLCSVEMNKVFVYTFLNLNEQSVCIHFPWFKPLYFSVPSFYRKIRFVIYMQCTCFILKIGYEFFRVIGVKYGNKSPHFFEISIFSLLPFIVPPYYRSLSLFEVNKVFLVTCFGLKWTKCL